MNIHMGSDVCGVSARATGRTKDGAETLTLGLIGRKEALMTAIVAAETVRQMLSGDPAGGFSTASKRSRSVPSSPRSGRTCPISSSPYSRLR